jgi:hypothetical protein
MPWAAVPEAAVNEDDQTLGAEDKVWSAWKGLMPPPARDARAPKDGDKLEFGLAVATRADCGHNLRAFCLRERVGHTIDYLASALVSRRQSANRFFQRDSRCVWSIPSNQSPLNSFATPASALSTSSP